MISDPRLRTPEHLWKWVGSPPGVLGSARPLAVDRATHAWSSHIALYAEEPGGRQVLYKRRLLLPLELVEMELVLECVALAKPQGVVSIIGWAVHEHHLHLFLDWVDGISLLHEHDQAGGNLDSFRRLLSSFGPEDKLVWTVKLLAALKELHCSGLLFQDLTLSQLVVGGREALLVDIDTVVRKDGMCARRGAWLPRSAVIGDAGANRGTDAYLAGLLTYELFSGSHYGEKEGSVPLAVSHGVELLLAAGERAEHGSPIDEGLDYFSKLNVTT